VLPTRAPAVAGTFYPGLPAQLRSDVRGLLGDGEGTRAAPAVVTPHAGYLYSGAVAGIVLGAVRVPASCIVLAPNHTGRVSAPEGGSLLLSRRYRTPLGEMEPDVALGEALRAAAAPLLEEDELAHAGEHAIEVVLPFLQLRNAEARLVPIVLGWSDWERTRLLAAAIAGLLRERSDVLVVASSDMNHYEPAEVSREKDSLALERIAALDGEGLLETAATHRVSMCGRVPVACACEVARLAGGTRGDVVAYAHSGQVNGDLSRVVGYAGIVLGDA
jgi:AmmeMemoRadiSam system protein B